MLAGAVEPQVSHRFWSRVDPRAGGHALAHDTIITVRPPILLPGFRQPGRPVPLRGWLEASAADRANAGGAGEGSQPHSVRDDLLSFLA
jgi:hypothetical protein